MKKSPLILLLLIAIFSQAATGQFSRVTLDLGYGYNLPLAGKFNITEGVKTVSLLNNFKYQGFETAELSYQLSESKRAGVLLYLTNLSAWKHSASTLYNGAGIKMFLAGPSAGLLLRKEGIPWGIKLWVNAAPVAGRYEIDLLNMVYTIISPSEPTWAPKNEKGMAFGLFGDVSLSKPLGRFTMLNLQMGLRYLHMEPVLTTDRNLFSLCPQIGFSFCMVKNKTFYIY